MQRRTGSDRPEAKARNTIELTAEPTTVTTAAPKPRYSIGGNVGSMVVLHLEFSLPSDAGALLRVYVNADGSSQQSTCDASSVVVAQAPGNTACPQPDGLVEEMYIVPCGPAASGEAPKFTCANLKLCEKLARDIEANGGVGKVTIVPVSLDSKGATGGKPKGVSVTMKTPYFTVED